MKNNSSTGATDETKISLRRVIGLPTGILLVTGIMIGSGVYKKIAPMSAALMNESYILAAWIIAGIITMIGALIISGLATMTTESGGVYEYLRLSVGNFLSFLYGWTVFTIIGTGSIAALAFIFAQSINTILHVGDPLSQFENLSIGNFIFPFASSGVKLIAVSVICLLTWVNYRGTRNGSVLNNVVTTAKILGIAVLIFVGLAFSHSTVVHRANAGNPLHLSGGTLFSALFGAMLSAFWAYDGWAGLSFISGEIKNPKRNVPIAIICGLAICMLLYVLLNYAFMQVLPLQTLSTVGENSIAAAAVANSVMGRAGTILISLVIAISTFSALNACIIMYPRIYFRMAQEDCFFRKVANVHPIFRTPYVALIWSMIWACVLVLSGTFDLLTNLVIFAGFFFYVLLAVGLIRMKRKKIITSPVIGYPFTAIVIILFATALIVNTVVVQTKQSVIGLFLVLSGVPVFYYFKQRKPGREQE